LIPRAVDELERIIAGAYQPGHGVAHTIGGAVRERGSASDHIYAASALLTAFELTGRLPYSMLAEELTQSFRSNLAEDAEVETIAEAVRVCRRLAALHENAEYRAAAVIAETADYRADAERLLAAIANRRGFDAEAVALYGLALANVP
jgi:uncharacterized protein YyaL (SSP411 family)